MILDLPDAVLNGVTMTPEKARLEMAIGLYAGREVSMGKAAKIAGLAYVAFMQEVGKREIALNYKLEHFEEDLRTLDYLEKLEAHAGHK